MINRATGEIGFASGLHLAPQCAVQSAFANLANLPRFSSQRLSLKGWRRHVLGSHTSDHGKFEVEALSADDERVHVVLLSHLHPFYEPNTPEDAERRAFHEGVISSDLAGQKEFTWGEVLHRLESAANKDWLVIAFSREAKVPLPVKEILLSLHAREPLPEENIH